MGGWLHVTGARNHALPRELSHVAENIVAIAFGVLTLVFNRRMVRGHLRFWHYSQKNWEVWEQGYRIIGIITGILAITLGIVGLIHYL